MNQKHYYVYIITNKRNTVLYVGVTSRLLERIQQHKEKQDKNSFTAKYNIDKLVYFEEYGDAYTAISREKQMKNLLRKKKIDLVEKMNSKWKDLVEELLK